MEYGIDYHLFDPDPSINLSTYNYLCYLCYILIRWVCSSGLDSDLEETDRIAADILKTMAVDKNCKSLFTFVLNWLFNQEKENHEKDNFGPLDQFLVF